MLRELPIQNLIDTESFQELYGHRPFSFSHRLAGHPLFGMDRLLELAEALTHISKAYSYNCSQAGIGQRWDEMPTPKIGLIDALRNIETADAWVQLNKAETVPAYRELLESCLDEMQRASGRDLSGLMKYRNCTIFISSPNRITNYHIDREWNCLLQIQGSKRVSIFDRNDREVLPEREIERFWTVDNNSAIWKPQFEDRARVFELTPGEGVHIPINSPHWVKNGPEVSVSLSVNFHLHDRLLAYVYRSNHWLRRAGLRPTPPGRSKWLDLAKGNGYASIRSLGNRLRGRVG